MIDIVQRLGHRVSRLLGRARLHTVMVLAIALTVSIWAPSAVAGLVLNPADNNGAAVDTAAILTLAENTEATDGQIDDLDDGSYSVVYRPASGPLLGLPADGTGVAAHSRNDSTLPHKTGPPTHA